jgi:hypothetical protein
MAIFELEDDTYGDDNKSAQIKSPHEVGWSNRLMVTISSAPTLY